jgi:anaerobic ribonucleoside-triphosphate reductase activating protein
LVELCDVIVDGRFVASERDTLLHFRGSRNQRIINVQKSLHGEIRLLEV